MKTRNLLTGALLLVAVLTQGAMALSRWGQSSVTILAHGFAGVRIEGKSTDVSLDQDASALTFKMPLAPIETGIGLRDRHLREILEAEKFPAAILRISRSDLIFPRGHQPVEGTAKGELTLHGHSRPVEVSYHAEAGAAGITEVRGSLQIDMRDFDIKAPSYLGVTVAPDVQVKLEMSVEGA